MMVHIRPKKVNRSDELKIDATFQHQGVRYSERYKNKEAFKKALARKKDIFINLVDFNSIQVVHRDDLFHYLSSK